MVSLSAKLLNMTLSLMRDVSILASTPAHSLALWMRRDFSIFFLRHILLYRRWPAIAHHALLFACGLTALVTTLLQLIAPLTPNTLNLKPFNQIHTPEKCWIYKLYSNMFKMLYFNLSFLIITITVDFRLSAGYEPSKIDADYQTRQ